jgi:hypothetical protein
MTLLLLQQLVFGHELDILLHEFSLSDLKTDSNIVSLLEMSF